MLQFDRIADIQATYSRHGWRLRRVLLSAETRGQLSDANLEALQADEVKEASLDALWFSRPSHEGRDAWELRLVAETPYALFETFEKDEPEEAREEVRREMEARLIEHATRP